MKFKVNDKVYANKVHFKGMVFSKGVVYDTLELKKSPEWERALLETKMGGLNFFEPLQEEE